MTALSDAAAAVAAATTANTTAKSANTSAISASDAAIASMQTALAALQNASDPLADMTAYAASLGYAASRKQWNEPFVGPTLDSTKWIPQVADQNGIWRKTVPAPMSGMDSGAFNLEYFDPAQVVVNNGLTINAQPSNAYPGYTYKSGAICTHGKFTMPSGLVLVKMQQPDTTTGMWPAIWLLEGGGEIDVQEGGYLDPATAPTNNLIASAVFNPNASQVGFNAQTDLSAGYNIFAMEYKPGVSVKTWINNLLVHTWTTGIGVNPYTLLLCMSVAGSQAAGWRSAAGANTPPVSTLKIRGVQWYQ